MILLSGDRTEHTDERATEVDGERATEVDGERPPEVDDHERADDEADGETVGDDGDQTGSQSPILSQPDRRRPLPARKRRNSYEAELASPITPAPIKRPRGRPKRTSLPVNRHRIQFSPGASASGEDAPNREMVYGPALTKYMTEAMRPLLDEAFEMLTSELYISNCHIHVNLTILLYRQIHQSH